jgi:hypothetical protein
MRAQLVNPEPREETGNTAPEKSRNDAMEIIILKSRFLFLFSAQ